MRMKSLMTSALGLCFLAFIPMAAAVEACDLPEDLQREIAVRYSGAKLVRLSDLSDDDRGFFQKDHGDSCPGLVKADFYGDGKPTLALVLIAKSGAKEKAKLVLAHDVGGRWETRIADTTDGAPVPVVWSQPPGEYRDVYGKKEIRATRPVIVLAGYESWAILYAWTGNKVTKIWLRD
jgi:hypothetical protein